MSKPSIVSQIREAVLNGEDDTADSLTREALNQGIAALTILNEGIVPGITEAGELWKKNEYFQSDVILSAEAFRVAMEIVEPKLSSQDLGKKGKVVIGTVAGDMHNLGKLMVVATLRSAGFEVIDLGEDVPTDKFISEVEKVKPKILGLGCYMTTTMAEMKAIIEKLKSKGLRNQVKVMLGGVPLTQEIVDEFGADAWGKDAFDTVEKAQKMVG